MTDEEFEKIKIEVSRNQIVIEEAYSLFDNTKINARLRIINNPD